MPQKNDQEAKAFKNWINEALLQRMANAIHTVEPSFDKKKFLSLKSDLVPLELKARIQRVREQLREELPKDYKKALEILLKSTKNGQLKGFDLWPYTDFIQTYGLDDFEKSLVALRQLTVLFTSEFAVRPFIRKDSQSSLQFLLQCTRDPNPHIRRWASEGSRPRLPWGEKLHSIIQEPTLTLPILEKLKHDDELYVRKSVANHLNDLTKDHPDLVLKTLKRWQSQSRSRHQSKIDWIIRHSLRTLIKRGHPKALSLIGVNATTKIQVGALSLNKKRLHVGDRLEFHFKIASTDGKPQKMVMDYVIHFVKANQQTVPKVFKLKNFNLSGKQELSIKKQHHLKKITTRVYYPGRHFLEIQINGKCYQKASFHLTVLK